jgi:probable phosphoglycerate mutase
MTHGLEGTRGRRRVYLMRHGEVSYFDAEGKPVDPRRVTLTEAGIAQARAMAEALADVQFDRAICSGLPRTRQTAEIVLGGRELPIEEREALREIRAGRFRDIPIERREAELAYAFEAAAQREDASFAGGERFKDFEARVVPAFEALLSEPGWTRLLLVAHDGVNRLILGWAAGAGRRGLAAFEQDMGCLNVIDVDVIDGEIVRRLIKAMNVTPYNLAKLGLHLTSTEEVFRGYR